MYILTSSRPISILYLLAYTSGGTITEPGAVGYIDLSGMSMQECCTKLFAFPLAIVYQIVEMVLALYYAVQRMVIVVQKMYERRKEAQELEKEKSELLGKRKSGKGFFRRLQKTVQRWIKKIPGMHLPFSSSWECSVVIIIIIIIIIIA